MKLTILKTYKIVNRSVYSQLLIKPFICLFRFMYYVYSTFLCIFGLPLDLSAKGTSQQAVSKSSPYIKLDYIINMKNLFTGSQKLHYNHVDWFFMSTNLVSTMYV